MRSAVLFLCCVLAVGAAEVNSVLIRNVTVHPVTSPEIPNGSVLVIDGKIAEVGLRVSASKGARVVDGRGLHLYPGMINAATNVGLAEIESLRDTVDLDEVGTFNPELRAEVAFNPSSEHVEVTRASGITSLLTLPGSGSRGGRGGGGPIIAGQGALMHLAGWTWEEMAVKRGAVLDMVFPQVQSDVPRQFAALLGTPAQTFQEREKQYKERLQQMSDFFQQARKYKVEKAAGGAEFRPDLRLEAMLPIIDGKEPVFVRAERERMIKDAIAFADKEKVKIIIAGPHEMGSTGSLLKEHHIPVVWGRRWNCLYMKTTPTMRLILYLRSFIRRA